MIWRLSWSIPEEQLLAIREFYQRYENTPMVNQRRKRNLDREGLDLSTDTFLKAMLCCLCTSQQRSGPDSKVAHFFRIRPFPVTEDYSRAASRSLTGEVENLLSKAGIRFSTRIAEYFTANLQRLEDSRWKLLEELRDYISGSRPDEQWERSVARAISTETGSAGYKLAGFGPKQARNLLQTLGISRYEVPLDSRVLKWLDKYGFPYSLSGNDLQHPALYEILVDSVKEISRQIDVYPCLLDAAIFSAVDGGGWTEDNLVF